MVAAHNMRWCSDSASVDPIRSQLIFYMGDQHDRGQQSPYLQFCSLFLQLVAFAAASPKLSPTDDDNDNTTYVMLSIFGIYKKY